MIEVYSNALDKTITTQRTITSVQGESEGPTVIFVGGIHGNEPSGVFAINNILSQLCPEDIQGNVYGLAGNLKALNQSDRFLDADLNRVWTQEKLDNAQHQELDEAKELLAEVNKITSSNSNPVFFFDLHTTSGDSAPFIVANNIAASVAFCKHLHLPVILGVEKYIQGTMFGYMADRGYISCGFEAGQHDDIQSILNHEIFIIRSLILAGVLKPELSENLFGPVALSGEPIQYQIKSRYHLEIGDKFIMEPGYKNFQKISEGELMAENNGEKVYSKSAGSIFLPLYQKKGEDGFFIIQKE